MDPHPSRHNLFSKDCFQQENLEGPPNNWTYNKQKFKTHSQIDKYEN